MAPIVNAHPDLERSLKFVPVENPAPRHLTTEQIATFNEKGYIQPLDVFSPEEATQNRAYFDRMMALALEAGHNAYSINGWHRHCKGLYAMMNDTRILDRVEDLLGPDFVCWGSHFFCKMPHDLKRVSWHQDASYWPLSDSRTVTVWLAIDDADEANGAMKLVPRSHLHGQIAFEHSTAEENNVLGQSVHGIEAYGDAPISTNLLAGQMSLHSDLLVHGSEPNPSDRRRCGLTLRYCPVSVRAYRGWNKNGFVVRGSDPSGHWVSPPAPTDDVVPVRG